MLRPLTVYALSLMAMCLCLSAHAQTRLQDMHAVWRTAEEFAREQTRAITGEVDIEMAPVEQKLRLAACRELKPYVPAGSRLWGKSHVGVRCQTPESWSLMVPLTIRVMGQALYSARPIGRGQNLAPIDIESRPADLTQLPAGVLTDPKDAIDKVATVALAAGLPLRRDMLKGATVVMAGDDVTVTFAQDNLRVSSMGKAVGNGAVGDPIQVRTSSGKVLRGFVAGKGVVEVR